VARAARKCGSRAVEQLAARLVREALGANVANAWPGRLLAGPRRCVVPEALGRRVAAPSHPGGCHVEPTIAWTELRSAGPAQHRGALHQSEVTRKRRPRRGSCSIVIALNPDPPSSSTPPNRAPRSEAFRPHSSHHAFSVSLPTAPAPSVSSRPTGDDRSRASVQEWLRRGLSTDS
jgi:hypothetical protein